MRAEPEQNKLSCLAYKTTETQNEIAFSCQAAPSVLLLCGCWLRAHRRISDSKNKQTHQPIPDETNHAKLMESPFNELSNAALFSARPFTQTSGQPAKTCVHPASVQCSGLTRLAAAANPLASRRYPPTLRQTTRPLSEKIVHMVWLILESVAFCWKESFN